MPETREPLIKLEEGGKAPILSYNVPEPTAYSGRNFIEMKLEETCFSPNARKKPTEIQRTSIKNMDDSALRSSIISAMKSGFTNTKLFPNIKVYKGILKASDDSGVRLKSAGMPAVSPELEQIDPDEVSSMMKSGMRLNIYRSMYGIIKHNYIPEPTLRPRLMLVETYRLSSFLGNYGAGRTIKTFSLLPGEKTKISIKTYTKRESDSKSASSILDSFTEESADDFEDSVQTEVSDKKNYAESFEYYADVEAGASWGWGNASVKSGVKGGTNSAREEFSKNVTNATQKHVAKASSKRDVQINTSYEIKEESGEETSIEREISNINLSRTLNFVFRQMNQEFITLLHLVDIRVAFFNGFTESMREVALPELDSLLEEYIIQEKRQEIKKTIIEQLQNIYDYQDCLHTFIEERKLSDDDKYFRVKKDMVSTYKDTVSNTSIAVPGIILSVMKSVLRTEGIIVEALLGEGEALDDYAKQLQNIEVMKRKAEAEKLEAEARRQSLINCFAKDGETEKAKILSELIRASNSAEEEKEGSNP